MTFKTKSFFPKWKCFFGAPFNDRLQSHSLDTPLAAQAPTSSFSQDNLKTFFSNNPDLLNLIKQHQRPTLLCCFCVWFQVPKDSNGKNKGNVSCCPTSGFPRFSFIRLELSIRRCLKIDIMFSLDTCLSSRNCSASSKRLFRCSSLHWFRSDSHAGNKYNIEHPKRKMSNIIF